MNNAKDIVVFLWFKIHNSDNSYMFSCNRNAQVTIVRKPQLKKICIFKLYTWISYSQFIRQGFKVYTVSNQGLPSFHEVLLEITLTVPLIVFKVRLDRETRSSLLNPLSDSFTGFYRADVRFKLYRDSQSYGQFDFSISLGPLKHNSGSEFIN